MNSYETIDPILNTFANRHGLHWYTEFQDYSIRATSIVDDNGNMYGMHVSKPGLEIQVNVAENIKNGKYETKSCSFEHLETTLEEMYQIVELWIKDSGNTRTPVL